MAFYYLKLPHRVWPKRSPYVQCMACVSWPIPEMPKKPFCCKKPFWGKKHTAFTCLQNLFFKNKPILRNKVAKSASRRCKPLILFTQFSSLITHGLLQRQKGYFGKGKYTERRRDIFSVSYSMDKVVAILASQLILKYRSIFCPMIQRVGSIE